VSSFSIPATVSAALNNLGLPNTVLGLLTLANKALGGVTALGGANLTDISGAEDAINEGFDECRLLIACSSVHASAHRSVDPVEIPKTFAVSANYPNPFNPTTTIDFDLPEASKVSMAVYNVLGQRVATLIDGEVAAGYQSVTWNTENNEGFSL